ncbi:MAG: hypothetical protein H7Z13_01860 [Ferruginibacter sp.]|nr:hypothetical protein [Ferruginibacter sp.]
MTGVFKSNNPYNTFLLLIYGLLLKMPMFIHPVVPVTRQTDGFLFKGLLFQLSAVGKTLPLIYPLITFLLLFTQAIYFNGMVNDQRLMQKSNYLSAMSYLLITSLFADWNVLSAPLIINTLLIWVWSKMSRLHNDQHAKTSLFNIGIAIGLSSFFYFPAIAFAALIAVGLLLSRVFKVSEWVVALLGIIVPYYFLLAWIFLADKWRGYHLPGVAIRLPHFDRSWWALVSISLVSIMIIAGLFYVQKNFRRQLVHARKSWNIIFFYMLIALFIPFINDAHSFVYWILSAIPIAAIMGAGFLYPANKWFPLALHWTMVAFVIAFSYFAR